MTSNYWNLKKLMRKQYILIFGIYCVQARAQSTQFSVNVYVNSINVQSIFCELKCQVATFLSFRVRDGNPLNDLKVTDSSAQLEIQIVNLDSGEVISDTPSLSILDTDSSHRTSERMDEVHESVLTVVSQLPDGNRNGMVEFNFLVNFVGGFAVLLNSARTVINLISPSQEWAGLFDGLAITLELPQSDFVCRRAMIGFSTGKDDMLNSFRKTFAEQIMRINVPGIPSSEASCSRNTQLQSVLTPIGLSDKNLGIKYQAFGPENGPVLIAHRLRSGQTEQKKSGIFHGGDGSRKDLAECLT